MKKFLLFNVIFFALGYSLKASNQAAAEVLCPMWVENPYTFEYEWSNQWSYLLNNNTQSYKIRVNMNRVNGAVFSMNQAEDLLDIINSTFSGLDISFHWDCIIHDVYDAVDTKNALDINISNIGGGDTPQMPGTQIEAGYTETYATVIHEIGHALGLLHTHESDWQEPSNVALTCEEYVNPDEENEEEINNGLTCADCIKSTNASRKLTSYPGITFDTQTGNCTYSPELDSDGIPVITARDRRGDVYEPQVENIMSYARSSEFDCRSEFVLEQGNRQNA